MSPPPVHHPPPARYGTPRASYRLQLNAEFTFANVLAAVPYLDSLGISHLYLSPIWAASPGSTHGYDVIDHGRINPELGGLAALYALGEALVAREMGLILDVVPNHVGVAGGDNPWWRDVLRFGPASHHADFFDIDWEAQPQLASGVLVLPILGKPFGEALEAAEFSLTLHEGEIGLSYYHHHLPVAPGHYSSILGLPALGPASRLTDPASLPALVEILDLLPRADSAQQRRLLDRFAALVNGDPAIRQYVEHALDEYTGSPGQPSSFDRLERVILDQHYRPADWRVAGEEINYRRFFDINDLAAIRVEREDVFEATHQLLFDLVARGIATAVRVDHIDGLYDPLAYLRRLRQRLDRCLTSLPAGSVPIYVEKILAGAEQLPASWPVAGATGYEFMARADGLLIDRSAESVLTRTWAEFAGESRRFGRVTAEARTQVADESFAGELNVLAMQLHRIARRHRRHRDNTLGSLHEALVAVMARFPVYRTYIDDGEPAPGSDATIERAVRDARLADPSLSGHALDFLREVLLLHGGDYDPDEMARRTHFRRRFQQVSGPVMAKGVEDTAFFRYARLLSLNEVGSDPAHLGADPSAVHAWFRDRARAWPGAMSATSTHDTKRGEGARARLHVLSELPREWRREVRAWARINARHRTTLEGESSPSAALEYYLYQTLVASLAEGGIDEAYRERLHTHLTKAMREAKQQTTWTRINEDYEAACHGFLDAVLDRRRSPAFVRRLNAFVHGLLPAAALNGTAQLLLKALAPGFPDFYQQAESGGLTLTDPDNRLPPDFAALEDILTRAANPPGASEMGTPAARLWLMRTLLDVRREHSQLLQCGDYLPLAARGPFQRHIFAFARTAGGRALVALIPRLPLLLLDGEQAINPQVWGSTEVELPPGRRRWRNLLTGAPVAASGYVSCREVLDRFPFAVLVSE
ncbi:MAG: malto-oligosyltrehalose synthase [Tepidiformaceae bacterium]